MNVLLYWEIQPDQKAKAKVQHFSWITDLALNADTVWDMMRGGRRPLEDRERDL